MSGLNTVETTVIVAGKRVHFVRLHLFQKFNTHHHVEIEIDYEEFGDKWMENPVKLINYIGESINITMKHKQTGEENLFMGIVTNVSFSGYHGNQNSIIITGASTTIKLDGKPAMDSFMDLSLQLIVQEAVSNSGNGGSVIAKPKFSSTLDYICQYNESCWDFLNRLSWQFGEWLFYDGLNCYFGLKYGDDTKLEYDREMTYFDLNANLSPQKFTRYQYLHHDGKEIEENDPLDVPGVRGYLKASKGRSESVYTSDVKIPLMPDVNTQKDLDDLVKAEKSRAVGEMLVVRGKTQTCKVKIGGVVTVRMPERMGILTSVDRFLVTEITHIVDQKGHYSNSFSGIVDGIEAIPMVEPKIPVALPQIATVMSNDDERRHGRVKVQTQWQKSKHKTTNWIRVQTPDAGSSDKVPNNRGLVTIPEKDDLVMLGFEYGDPSRPYVAGSIFSERISQGGGTGNSVKSMTTRSGSTVTFDDGKGSVLIKDKAGSESKIILDGEKNIQVESDKSVDVNVGKGKCILHLQDDGTTTITAENKIEFKVGGNIFTMTPDSTSLNTPTSVSIKSANNSITGKNHITGGNTKIDGGDVFVN
ncbi:MAG: phage baseplate assembly protein V [Prevotella sp.]|jgi:uncharacterized protein involved in type VI secretion and phage assembly|nr:phage baseplate assembly protein V [Prevotella sp.]